MMWARARARAHRDRSFDWAITCSKQSANERSLDRSHALIQQMRRQSGDRCVIHRYTFSTHAHTAQSSMYSFHEFVVRKGSPNDCRVTRCRTFIKTLSSAFGEGSCRLPWLQHKILYFSNNSECLHGIRVHCDEHLGTPYAYESLKFIGAEIASILIQY